MKTKILSIILSLAALFNCAAEAQTKSIEPRTVTDFYLLLPANFVNGAETVGERRERIEIEDVKNGYLKLKPGDEQEKREYTEIALFKKTGGGYVVAVAKLGCAENCLSNVQFLERRADRWTEISSRVYPISPDADLAMYRLKKTAAHRDYDNDSGFWTQTVLPREGKTIRVKYTGEGAGKEFELFSAMWNGERFVPDEELPANLQLPAAPSEAILQAAETAWKPFFARLQAAVKTRDRKTLRTLMSENFSYNCCDQPYPDNRSGAFTTWDGDPKDYRGWKNLERELRTVPFYESSNGREPMRFINSAAFSFTNNRWFFNAYGEDEM